MKALLLSTLAAALPLGSASASIVYSFEDTSAGYVYTNPTRTKLPSAAWTLSPSAANVLPDPFAWTERDADLNHWGAIGTTYATIATGPVTVGAALPASALPNTRVTVDLMLRDSLDPTIPGRDAFGFSILATDSTVLFSAAFTPDNSAGLPGTTATWSVTATGLTGTLLTMTEDESYRFFIDFTVSGFVLGIADENGLPVSELAGTTPGYDPSKTLGSIVFSTTEVVNDWASGQMLFDDIDVGTTPVPEASVALLGAVGCLGLLRRGRSA